MIASERMWEREVPHLETERLILRRPTLEDAKDMFVFASLAEVTLPAGFPPVKTLEDEIIYLKEVFPKRFEKENLPVGYGITLKGEDKVVGTINFNRRLEEDVWEIGYLLHPNYWGQGMMPEAARAFIDYAFKELGLHKIELGCYSTNPQSQAVAEKLGFTLEARIRDRRNGHGERCDDLRYGLFKSEWEGNQ